MSGAHLVEKRKPLTRAEVLTLCIAQQGRCGCGCGVHLDPIGEGVIDEHVIALELTGPNALTNRKLYRKPCAKAKTAKHDAPAIAKAKRIAARIDGTRRARKPIPNRPFDTTRTKKFDGSVVPRTEKEESR
jgi:hypothetical protein